MPVQRAPRPSAIRSFHLAAPVGGLNTIAPGVEMPASDCSFVYNMIAAEMGLRTRLGWYEWCTGMNGEQVRSILSYTGSTKDGNSNRLFACTISGIWDCSASVVGPTRVVTFGTQNTDSGWGCARVMVTSAGHFLLYTDEANGYHVYTESITTWAKIGLGAGGTQVANVDPGLFAWVLVWKSRAFFVERDSGRAWYLAAGSIYGSATVFNFGTQFKHGGDLRALESWTGTGGATLDDQLVAVSGGGDAVIYAGTDPANASTFGIQGVWYVGAVPAGRRLFTDIGGDLAVMSSLGVLSLSQLTTGLVLYDRSQYRTAKISNLFNQLQAATANLRGWAMRLHPKDNAVMVLVPTAPGQPTQQLAMSLITKGWFQYRDMPIGVCAEPWEGSLFFGTEDGRVCVNDGYVDGVTLASPGVSTPIGWSLLSAYSNLGRPTMKRVSTIRPTVLSQGGAVAFQSRAQFGWNLSEQSAPAAASPALGSAWDTALWDTAIWGGTYQSQSKVSGGSGVGREMAIAVRGTSSSRMTLTGIDVAWNEGGIR